jgi:hypothetical protein
MSSVICWLSLRKVALMAQMSDAQAAISAAPGLGRGVAVAGAAVGVAASVGALVGLPVGGVEVAGVAVAPLPGVEVAAGPPEHAPNTSAALTTSVSRRSAMGVPLRRATGAVAGAWLGV